MPEAATAIFYSEEFFFLQAGWCNVCFINIMVLCLHFPQKLSMKIALPLTLDKQGVFASQFYGHSHASSCPICSSLDGSACGYSYLSLRSDMEMTARNYEGGGAYWYCISCNKLCLIWKPSVHQGREKKLQRIVPTACFSLWWIPN